MTDSWSPTQINGVLLRHDVPLDDKRGQFMELWRASTGARLGASAMVQANLSRSHRGVLRGMHVHLRQDDLWLVLSGHALAATADLRGSLAGADVSVSSELIELDSGDALFVPAGVGHGFLARTDLTLVYLVTNEYDGSDEHGFAWDDPDAAIPWPEPPTIMSERDRANPALRALVARLRQLGQIESR